jgi:hypothetical protein
MKMLRLHAWFLETLERGLGLCREKVASIYDTCLSSNSGAPMSRPDSTEMLHSDFGAVGADRFLEGASDPEE